MTKCKFAIHCPQTLAVVMTGNIMVRAKQFRYYNSITGWACIILMKKLIRGDWKKSRQTISAKCSALTMALRSLGSMCAYHNEQISK